MYNDFNYEESEVTECTHEDIKCEFAELIRLRMSEHEMSLEEAANALRVSKSTIYHIIHNELDQYTAGQLGTYMMELREYCNG